jgi:integrase
VRQALFGWAYNPATRDTDPPPKVAAALDGAERASLPVAELKDTATMRLALTACARTLAGKPAAGATKRRKRSVSYNALGYAVEQGHLPANPVDRTQWTAPAVAQSVDRRVVVSPAQARNLLAAFRGLSGRGQHLEAFYACLYSAALRPSEAVMLRGANLQEAKTASRQPEMPGQRREAGRTVGVTARTGPSVAFPPRPWPKPGAHGRIADGGGPGRSLERHTRWPSAWASGRRDGL